MNKTTLERTARLSARMARIVGFATLGTTAGLASSIFLGGPAVLALLGAGAGRLAFGAASTAAGATAGYALGKRFEDTKGRARKNAFESIQQKDIGSAEDLSEQQSAEELGSDKALQTARAKRENIGALFTGLGISSTLLIESGGLEAVHHASSWIRGLLEGKQPPSTSSALPALESLAKPPDTSQVGTIELTVGKGEGADKLLTDLQEKLNNLPKGAKMPPHLEAIQKILHDNPHHLAQQLKLSHEVGGIMLQPGDTLDINEQGQLVFHEAIHGNRPTILMSAKGEIDPEHKWLDRFKDNHTQAHQEHHPTHNSHIKYSEPKPQGMRTPSTFDAKADHEAVALANLEELAREKAGVFSSAPTSVQTAEQAIATASQSSTGIQSPEGFTNNLPDGQPAAAMPLAEPLPPVVRIPEHTAEPSSHPGAEQVSSPRPSIESPIHTEFPPEYAQRALPYVNDKGDVFVYGGANVSPQQLEVMARSHAQANPGRLVRFTIPRHGFLGTIKAHVEGIIFKGDGTYEVVKKLPNGKPFPPIDKTTFTSISRDQP